MDDGTRSLPSDSLLAQVLSPAYPPAAPQIGRALHPDTDWPCRWTSVSRNTVRVSWFAFPHGDEQWELRVSTFRVGVEDEELLLIEGEEPDGETLDVLARDMFSGRERFRQEAA